MKPSPELIELRDEIAATMQRLNLDQAANELSQLQEQMKSADFWQDPKKAADVAQREAKLRARVETWHGLLALANDLIELTLVADPAMRAEIDDQAEKISKRLEELKQELRFNGPYDERDVIISIYAGAGGTDAQDWAQMLLRMYTRWAESNGCRAEMIDQSAGEEAGIKSATFKIIGGDYLYGRLKEEQGVHRLVRQSPFNSAASRETSFAKVDVLPLIDQPGEVEIDDKDLKIDVFRAGGHGGQSVNTTDSAVRVTHLPTGITVSIQNERSQLQNKETALAILRSRLVALQQEQHAKDLSEIKGPNQSAEWGNQIRSYVLHPYKQVKDLRSGYETSDAEKILDGNLNPLINAALEKR
ncbi:MAG TPA: peptide chain release factor 2 [Candidatus Saccharimonadales bacterium]|nr:peptide chain release factor 2 [Candidatus Saccharimonadales bacterium]